MSKCCLTVCLSSSVSFLSIYDFFVLVFVSLSLSLHICPFFLLPTLLCNKSLFCLSVSKCCLSVSVFVCLFGFIFLFSLYLWLLCARVSISLSLSLCTSFSLFLLPTLLCNKSSFYLSVSFCISVCLFGFIFLFSLYLWLPCARVSISLSLSLYLFQSFYFTQSSHYFDLFVLMVVSASLRTYSLYFWLLQCALGLFLSFFVTLLVSPPLHFLLHVFANFIPFLIQTFFCLCRQKFCCQNGSQGFKIWYFRMHYFLVFDYLLILFSLHLPFYYSFIVLSLFSLLQNLFWRQSRIHQNFKTWNDLS